MRLDSMSDEKRQLVSDFSIVQRDFSRPEEDDWKLRVQHRLSDFKESMPMYDESGNLTGWKIQYRYE